MEGGKLTPGANVSATTAITANNFQSLDYQLE